MTPDVALWIAGAVASPALGWAIHLTILMTKQREDVRTLLEMHRKPDEYGFGTDRTNRIIEDNTRAMEALTHYIQWLINEQTGSPPPPPLNPAGTSIPAAHRP